MNRFGKKLWILVALVSIFEITASCKGKLKTPKRPGGDNQNATVSHFISGNVSGLAGQVVVELNSKEQRILATNGRFTFNTQIAEGNAYVVKVLVQPENQICSVGAGAGTVSQIDVTDITVVCSNEFYSVGGAVSNLSGSLVLQNNADDNLAITSSGTFTFETPVAVGATYNVSVLTQPAGQTCSISSGSGTIEDMDITNVVVNCTTNTFTIGGTVAGLSGGTLVLLNNGGNGLNISSDGNFSFPTPVVFGGSYNVTIQTQPAGQTCSVQNGTGTNISANVTSVNVTCLLDITFFATNDYSGNLGGRAGADAKCEAAATSMTCDDVHAVISIDSSDEARDFPAIYGVPTNVPIKSITGTRIANNWNDLLDGSIQTTLETAGVFAGSVGWWSGENATTESSGIAGSNDETCNQWTSEDSGVNAVLGNSSVSGNNWLTAGASTCDAQKPILCMCY